MIPDALGDAMACWNPYTTDIYIDDDSMDQGIGIQTLWHEYGHYVNHSYGGFSSWCTPGDNEGDALHETFADLHVLAFIARNTIVASTYQQPGMIISQFPGRHRGSIKKVYDPDGCDVVPYDEHDVGIALEQAFWEVLWNQNCETGDTCPTNLTAFGDDIFTDASHTQTAVNSIIAEAVARSMQATTADVTFDETVHWMSVRVGTLTDSATRGRFDAVMIHHGFDP